jgi:hypothetical protein
MLPKQRRIVGVAVTRGNELLMLRDRLRIPVRTMVNADVLHVYHENKQVQLPSHRLWGKLTLIEDCNSKANGSAGSGRTHRVVTLVKDLLWPWF